MDFTNPNPVGSGPFNRVTRFNAQDYVLGKNPNYWHDGPAEDPVHRADRRCVERRRDRSRSSTARPTGRTTSCPNVETAYQAKDPAHYHNAYLTTALPIGLFFDLTQVPVQHRRLPQGRQPGDRPQDGLEARRVRLRAADVGARDRADVSEVDRPVPEGAGEGDGDLQPGRGEDGVHRRRLHLQGQQADRPEGRSRSASTIHVIGGWSDWVASLQIITRTCVTSASTRTSSSSPTGAPGSRTR